MPDKRIEMNPQIPKRKNRTVHSGPALDNQDAMSNSTEIHQSTEHIGSKEAYAVLNRNGMINSLDPANQNINLRSDEGDTAPVIVPAAETKPGRHPSAMDKARGHKR